MSSAGMVGWVVLAQDAATSRVRAEIVALVRDAARLDTSVVRGELVSPILGLFGAFRDACGPKSRKALADATFPSSDAPGHSHAHNTFGSAVGEDTVVAFGDVRQEVTGWRRSVIQQRVLEDVHGGVPRCVRDIVGSIERGGAITVIPVHVSDEGTGGQQEGRRRRNEPKTHGWKRSMGMGDVSNGRIGALAEGRAPGGRGRHSCVSGRGIGRNGFCCGVCCLERGEHNAYEGTSLAGRGCVRSPCVRRGLRRQGDWIRSGR